MLRIVALLVLAGAIAYAAHAFAQATRADVRPPLQPISSASSNGVSFAWFYDPAVRSVIVCRVGSGGADLPDCRARATLP